MGERRHEGDVEAIDGTAAVGQRGGDVHGVQAGRERDRAGEELAIALEFIGVVGTGDLLAGAEEEAARRVHDEDARRVDAAGNSARSDGGIDMPRPADASRIDTPSEGVSRIVFTQPAGDLDKTAGGIGVGI